MGSSSCASGRPTRPGSQDEFARAGQRRHFCAGALRCPSAAQACGPARGVCAASAHGLQLGAACHEPTERPCWRRHASGNDACRPGTSGGKDGQSGRGHHSGGGKDFCILRTIVETLGGARVYLGGSKWLPHGLGGSEVWGLFPTTRLEIKVPFCIYPPRSPSLVLLVLATRDVRDLRECNDLRGLFPRSSSRVSEVSSERRGHSLTSNVHRAIGPWVLPNLDRSSPLSRAWHGRIVDDLR